MLLIVEIGNTNIKFVIHNNDKPKTIVRLSTSSTRTIDEYHIFFQYLLTKNEVKAQELSDIIISSVVPDINSTIIEACELYFQLTTKFIQEDLVKNLQIKISFPNKIVGIDRLANIIAANFMYPNTNTLIIDMGSVTTFNLIDSNNCYYGQVITPGINSFANSIASSASLLSKAKVCEIQDVVANSTISAMESGIFWGYKTMVMGLINLIRSEKKIDYIIATGGNSRFFKKGKDIDLIDTNLTTTGLVLIYRNHL